MQNNLTPEQIATIESNMIPTRSSCTILNNIQKEITGIGNDSCFCSSTARRQFLTQFTEWYNSMKNE